MDDNTMQAASLGSMWGSQGINLACNCSLSESEEGGWAQESVAYDLPTASVLVAPSSGVSPAVQAITAAGSGCKAALSAERYLAANSLLVEFKPKEADPPRDAAVDAHQALVLNTTPKAPSPTDEATFDINATKFHGQYALRRLYHESDRLIAVLYSSPTCGPCRSLKPILNGVVDEYAGRIHYVEIDITEDPEMAEAGGVTGTPSLQLFKHKDMLKIVTGVKQKREYRSIFDAAM